MLHIPSPPSDLPTRDTIERFVRQAIRMLIDSGAVRILATLLVEEQREPGVLDALRERVLGPRRVLVVEMLQRGIDRGEVRPDIDPLVVTEMIAGAIFGHHMTATDDWIESLVDHIWMAIKVPDS